MIYGKSVKFKMLICTMLLFILMFSSVAVVDAQPSTAVSISQPVFANPLTGFINDFLEGIYQSVGGAPMQWLHEAIFDDNDKILDYIEGTKGGDNIQKWFNLFQVAGLLFIPLILIRIAVLLIGSFVNGEKRSELKNFIKTTILVVIIFVFAKDAIRWLIELNDAIVALFKQAGGYIAVPKLPDSAAGSVLGFIVGIIVALADLFMTGYVVILLFIRKVIITIAYMLIPIAAIMLYTNKFKGVFNNVYTELLNAIFKQSLFAATYVILNDILITFLQNMPVAKDNDGLADMIFGQGWFVQWVTEFDGEAVSGGPVPILGPLGLGVLLYLLIKIEASLEKLLGNFGHSSFAPDPGAVMKSGLFAVGSFGTGLEGFTQRLVGAGSGFGDKMGRIVAMKNKFKEQGFKNTMGSIGNSIKGGLKSGNRMKTIGKGLALPFQVANKAVGTLAVAATPLVGLGMAASGIGAGSDEMQKFNEGMKSIGDAGGHLKNFGGGFIGAYRAHVPKKEKPGDSNGPKDILGSPKIKGSIAKLNEKDIATLGLNDNSNFYTDNQGNFAVGDEKGKFKYFKRNQETNELQATTAEEMLASKGITSDAMQQKARNRTLNGTDLGMNEYIGSPMLSNGNGENTYKSTNFKAQASEHFQQRAQMSTETVATMDVGEISSSKDLQSRLENHKGQMSVVVDGNNMHFMGDDGNGNFKMVDQVKLTQQQMESVRKELNIEENGAPQICNVEVENGSISFKGSKNPEGNSIAFTQLSDVENIVANDAVVNSDRRTIKKHITMSAERSNELNAEIDVLTEQKQQLKSDDLLGHSTISSQIEEKQKELVACDNTVTTLNQIISLNTLPHRNNAYNNFSETTNIVENAHTENQSEALGKARTSMYSKWEELRKTNPRDDAKKYSKLLSEYNKSAEQYNKLYNSDKK